MVNEIDDPALPAPLAHVPAAMIVVADVRAELRAGREPFGTIMAALEQVPHGGVLCVRAIFEPAPLYAVLGRKGWEHVTERFADDDWVVWFHAPGTMTQATVPQPAPDASAQPGATADVVIIDVRGLEPPEPMVQTLAALENLPAGATLLQLNERVPRFLLPVLEERGWTYQIREQGDDGVVRLFIRRPVPPAA